MGTVRVSLAGGPFDGALHTVRADWLEGGPARPLIEFRSRHREDAVLRYVIDPCSEPLWRAVFHGYVAR